HRLDEAIAEEAAEEGLALGLVQLERARDGAGAYFKLREPGAVVGEVLVQAAEVGAMTEHAARHLRLQMFQRHESARVEAEVVRHALAPACGDVGEEGLERPRYFDDLFARTLFQRQYCRHDRLLPGPEEDHIRRAVLLRAVLLRCAACSAGKVNF